MLGAHTYARADERVIKAREDQVCLILSRRVFVEEVLGCESLLSIWGGEGIYITADDMWSELRELGRPAIVVAAIDLSSERGIKHVARAQVQKVFVGIELDLQLAIADVFYRTPVPPEDILDVWHPGDEEYDRFSDLPRACRTRSPSL